MQLESVLQMTKKEIKTPLDNDTRIILKKNKYKCCGKEFSKRGVGKWHKAECKCGVKSKPIGRVTWYERWFGHFQ